jgi:hypothetical protein
LIGANSRWDHAGEPYWEGEVEECINGRTVADGAYFGVDVSSIVGRLAGERLDDGGWNCERINGSARSSFATTINVLEGLLEYQRATGGTPQSREARKSGEEFLLERSLFRRLSTGEPADGQFLRFVHPNRWRYDVLRALDYFRRAAALTGAAADPRLGEAVGHIRSRRSGDGTWPLDWSPAGRVWFDVDDGAGKPSRWVTLRSMRVLRWWEAKLLEFYDPPVMRQSFVCKLRPDCRIPSLTSGCAEEASAGIGSCRVPWSAFEVRFGSISPAASLLTEPSDVSQT